MGHCSNELLEMAVLFDLSDAANYDFGPIFIVFRSHSMSQCGAARKSTVQVVALWHELKIWLNAPVVFGRPLDHTNVDKVHQTDRMAPHASVAAIVLHVCWLSILLGLAIQISLLIVSVAFGRVIKLNPLIVDCAQRTAWSTIVCSSISVALVASKLRDSFAGLAGLLSASVGFKIARAVQKGVGAALGSAPLVANGPAPLVLGTIKAVEYACLALVLSWMTKRTQRGAVAHAAIGLAVGVFFGGIALGYTYWTNIKLLNAADVVSRGLNEILFPVGCALVLFATEVWSKHWKISNVPPEMKGSVSYSAS